MNEELFKQRTRQIGLRRMRTGDAVIKTRTADVVVSQLIRIGTSVSAICLAACRARTVEEVLSGRALQPLVQ